MMALRRPGHAWRLADLLAGFGAVGAGADIGIGEIALDSRRVVPGTLFLACPGRAGHGMAYAEHARARGAAAIAAQPSAEWDEAALDKAAARLGLPVVPVPGLIHVVSALADRFYGEPSAQMEVIGIAGNAGKTSVAHLLAQALAAETHCAVLSDLGLGFPGDLASQPEAACDAVTLQAALAAVRGRGAQVAAVALSAGALARRCAAALRLSHLVVTNTSDSDPQVAGAVKGFVGAGSGLRWVVLSADDPAAGGLLADLDPDVRVALFGSTPFPPLGWRHDIWVGLRALHPLRRGVRLAVVAAGGVVGGGDAQEAELQVGLLGASNASNLLAVLAVLLSRGLALPPALHALAKVHGVPGRLEGFGGEQAPLVAVDGAQTPDALARAIANLRHHTSGRLLTVFGCRGGGEPGQRARLGAVAEAGSDLVIVTDNDPGSEDGDRIIADILGGMRRPECARVERQRGLAIRIALTLAGASDSVLVAGKGHATTQDMGELKVRFSDRAQVAQALREWTEGRR